MEKTVIVKIGTSIATTKRGRLHVFRMSQIAKQIKLLQENGVGVILVVSAAVACGMGITHKKLGDVTEQQLLAGIGQAHAIATLFSIFENQGLTISQLLLTKQNFETKETIEILRKIIQRAFENNIILAVNENDIVELHSFSGNDFLASLLAQLIHASYLCFLSDIEGVYDSNMEVINTLSFATQIQLATIHKQHIQGGIGGIASKIRAAQEAAEKGTITYIAHGQTKNILVSVILQNQHIGTKVIGGRI